MIATSKGHADYVLLFYFIIWLLFGLIMLTSASSVVELGDKYFFIKRQLLLGVLPGIIGFFIVTKLDLLFFKRWSLFIFLGCITLLVAVFIPGIGTSLGTGAHSWIRIAGYSFQPAEFAKLGTVIFMAALLSDIGTRIKDFKKGFLLALGLASIPLALVLLQPDVGTASILFAIIFVILFVAEANIWHILSLLLAGFGGFLLMILVAPYRAARFTTFLHPELDPLGIGYQINQAFLAIGSGGWLGRGLGQSLQKHKYLPEVHADSIFAIIAEEMGFIFVLAFIILLVLIALRGLKVAKNSSTLFGRFVASGIMVWFMAQSFLNIGAMVGLLPLTGVPLPFVSHGGTALMTAIVAVGVLINVSKQQA